MNEDLIDLQPTLSQLNILIQHYIRLIDIKKTDQVDKLNQLNKIYKALEKIKKAIEIDK